MPKKRKQPLNIQRKALRVQLPKQADFEMFFYKVVIEDNDIQSAEQIPDYPFEHTEENGSLVTYAGIGIAIHVTWLPFKPAPGTDLRYRGYLKVVSDMSEYSPAWKKFFENASIGFGHLPDATVEFHPPKGDDA